MVYMILSFPVVEILYTKSGEFFFTSTSLDMFQVP